ncbi:hypothetical protein [Micromonospora sp. URMC 103]|uniref:hypothetical protein n=1 Tax=Micromonospora sp. URMC 103 TaxID=3423406 RepID=UPI003F19E84C
MQNVPFRLPGTPGKSATPDGGTVRTPTRCSARWGFAAVADAERRDPGTVVLPDGRLADRAMVAAARRTVDLAARYAA